MKLKIGDKVLIKDRVGKGSVVKIVHQKIYVLDEDGFELSYDEKQLILIEVEQSELSRYSDINNKMLRQKESLTDVPKRSAKKTNKKSMELLWR